MMRHVFLVILTTSLSAGFALAAATELTVVRNATVYTMNPEIPKAQALAWSSAGEILAVGDERAVIDAYPDARVLDLAGKTVVPGLIDAHAHLMGLGQTLMRADLVDTRSKTEVVARLKAFEEDLPEGAWLLGRGWDQNDWAEKVFPSRDDLDRVFPTRPVWVRRIDGHAGWANSAALRVADRRFDGDWQPEGGRVERDTKGRATGVFVDRAMDLIESKVPAITRSEQAEALNRALAHASSLGLTGVHEAGTSLANLRLYQSFIDRGAFSLRLYAMADGAGPALEHLCDHGYLEDSHGLLSARSVKFYADGALGSRGAALLAPYSDDRGNSGLLIQPAAQLAEMIKRAMGCDLQVAAHAIGDRGNRVVLDALEAASEAYPDNPGRHRIEHAQVVALEDLPRFKQLALIASVQPTHATSDMYWAEERVGPERIKGAYAWRKLRRLGISLALGSDFPVERVSPLLGFYAAITRQDARGWPDGGWYAGERLGRSEALHGFTLGAAFAAFQEDRVGSLEVGKHADLVILSDDIMEVPPIQILETKVLMTIVGGRIVFGDDRN